jgi:hypothetical protein
MRLSVTAGFVTDADFGKPPGNKPFHGPTRCEVIPKPDLEVQHADGLPPQSSPTSITNLVIKEQLSCQSRRNRRQFGARDTV